VLNFPISFITDIFPYSPFGYSETQKFLSLLVLEQRISHHQEGYFSNIHSLHVRLSTTFRMEPAQRSLNLSLPKNDLNV